MTIVATDRFGAATAGAPPPPEPLVEPEPRKRHRLRWTLLTLLAVLVVVGALLGGRFWGAHGQKQVWALRADLARGATLTSGDLETITVKGDAANGLVPTSTGVAGSVLNRSMPAGVGLPAASLGGVARFPGPTETLVGVGLPSGNAPAGLTPGAKVTVYALPASSNGEKPPPATSQKVLGSVEVVAVTTVSSGGEVATLVVPKDAAAGLAALSAQQRIAVTLIS